MRKHITTWGLVLKLGKFVEAAEAFKKAILFKPDYAEAYNNMGNAFIEQGKFGEAIEVFKKALSINPAYAESYTIIWVFFKDQGSTMGPLKAWGDKAISIRPNYAEAYYNLQSISSCQGLA